MTEAERSVAVLSASMLLDTLVVGSLWAVLPSVLHSTAHPSAYGRMLGAASLLGALANAALGALSDRHRGGRRAVYQLAVLLFAACPVCLLMGTLLGRTTDSNGGGNSNDDRWRPLLVLGALLSRQQASHAIAKAYVSDTTPAAGRTAALARLASFSGAGFVIGPSLGGWLARGDASARSSLTVCSALCATNVLLGALGLRGGGVGGVEGASPGARAQSQAQAQAQAQAKAKAKAKAKAQARDPGATLSGLHAALELLGNPRIALLLTVQLFLSLGFQSFTSVFAAYCRSRFGFGAVRYGNVLSFCGVVWATTQGVLVPWAKKHLVGVAAGTSGGGGGENASGAGAVVAAAEFAFLRWTTALLVVGRLTLASAFTVPRMLLGEVFVIVGAAGSFTLITSLLTQAAPAGEAGRVVGLSSALENVCGIVAPPCVGVLFEAYGDAAGALVAAGFNVGALGIVLGGTAVMRAPKHNTATKEKRVKTH